eukprot:SAG11_NODE_718_length_7584_cov_10.771009_3_plen_513_part_00
MSSGLVEAARAEASSDRGAGPKEKGQLMEMTLGTWNVQALGRNVLEMALGQPVHETKEQRRQRAVPMVMHMDILGLTETHWREKHLEWADESGGRFLCGERPVAGDKAAGVGLVLSAHAARKLISWGTCEGGRVIWARLRGAFHDMLVVNAYVPHRGRKAPPFMEDTMEQINQLLREKKKAGDCVAVMGDMNGRLPRGKAGDKRVGPFTPHARGDDGGKFMSEMMEEFDLWAPLSFFKPARSRSVKTAGMSAQAGEMRLGNATFIMERRLPRSLRVEGVKAQAPAMLDYILLSRRYRSSVTSAQVRWGAGICRHGVRRDHGLVEVKWRFRVRCDTKGVPKRDFRALQQEEVRQRYDTAADEALAAPDAGGAVTAAGEYNAAAAGANSTHSTAAEDSAAGGVEGGAAGSAVSSATSGVEGGAAGCSAAAEGACSAVAAGAEGACSAAAAGALLLPEPAEGVEEKYSRWQKAAAAAAATLPLIVRRKMHIKGRSKQTADIIEQRAKAIAGGGKG